MEIFDNRETPRFEVEPESYEPEFCYAKTQLEKMLEQIIYVRKEDLLNNDTNNTMEIIRWLDSIEKLTPHPQIRIKLGVLKIDSRVFHHLLEQKQFKPCWNNFKLRIYQTKMPAPYKETTKNLGMG